ncbi:uncharacterized protein LOC113231118, partial [Hyposmocoma kahamanoa]|uniref:uncharacterized protein LOC113231118 n=1 Tax=Hyposmocoma kahamanoa TaxID=1477025 RepID=UPI000E6D95FF
MFGFRTPAKESIQKKDSSPREEEKRKMTEGAGSPVDLENKQTTSKVRRSVGEIEARRTSPQLKKQEQQPQHGEKPKPKPTTGGIKLSFGQKATTDAKGCSQKGKPTSIESEKSPTSKTPTIKYKTRTAEAKACLLKAKIQIDKSRNLKSDIKADVLEAVERLYALVKEAEEGRKSTITTHDQVQPVHETIHSDLATRIEEHSKHLKEHTKKMEELKEAIEKERQRDQVERLTYASVAAHQNIRMLPNKRETLHSVVITSTDENDTGEQVLDRVRKAVDAKEGWLTVQKVRKAKDRKIVMSFKSKEDQAKAKEKLSKNENHLVVEEMRNKDPLLILRDVLIDNKDEGVLKALRNQNREIFKGLDEGEDRVVIKYRKRARNPLTGHIILSTSPKIWRRAVDAGMLHIDLQQVRVTDQSPLVQCSRCLAYGHGRRFCKETEDLCSHCGGPHLRAQCPEWLANAAPTCRNCSKAKLTAKVAHGKKLPLHVIQANLQRKQLATHELFMEAGKRKAAIALLQEPYVGGANNMKGRGGARIFQCTNPGNGTVKAAIAVFHPDLQIIQYPQLTTTNICVVGIRAGAWEVTCVSYYFEDTEPIGPYLDQIRKIGEQVNPRRWLLGGDSNAKSTWWGSNKIDARGEEMAGTLDDLGLIVLNSGEIPTFDVIRGGKRYSSHVDVTACSVELLDLVDCWRIAEDLTSSDHNGIVFDIHLQKITPNKIKRTTRIYNTKKVNWAAFHVKLGQLKQVFELNKSKLEEINTIEALESVVSKFTEVISRTCEETIPKINNRKKLTLPWWSEELETLKKEVATRKSRIRCAAPVRKPKVVEEYLKHKEKYESEAAKAQIRSWKEFCEKQDREGLWEGIYRVIGRTSKREEDVPLEKEGEVLDARSSAKLLAETFYPEDLEENDNCDHRTTRLRAKAVNEPTQNCKQDPPFTMVELKTAISSFNPKKAPGGDGFTADICLNVVEQDPHFFLDLVNKCLTCHHFPRAWKEATVVVLRKPGKEKYTTPKAYRPIGLLSVLGKTLEKLIVSRLKYHILPKISTHQYGFMPQRSTEDSLYTLLKHLNDKLTQKKLITLVSLDIEGAFDSAWWPAIKVRLAEENCPLNLRKIMDSYLSDRKVKVRYCGEEYQRETQKGCVQGSIGGPILWNLLLDPLLKRLEKGAHYCQAFADDVVLIFNGETAQEVQRRANCALECVREWGVANKLKFAPHKTSAMVITRKLKYDTPRLNMGGVNIGMSKEIKLLGVILDEKLAFNQHVAGVCKKAISIYYQLQRAAKVSWGLHPEVIRTIYTATVEPIILYAASVWAPAVKRLGIQKQLNAVQRGFARKLCRGYRTVSLNSALVLAGMLPLDIRVREAASLYEAKRGVPQSALGDREVERMTPALQSPHPAEHIGWEFKRLVNQEHLDLNSNFDIRIFTDGSKVEGKVGAALSMWNGAVETKTLKLTLSSYCTVYQSELLAICKATREAVKSKANSIGIYSDSMAALQTVTNLGALHPLAVETRQNLRKALLRNKYISLFWIKAHAGLEGNERADHLAKEAAVGSKRRPDYDLCPVSFVKRIIRMESLDEWNRRYQNAETAGVTKLFFPDAVAAYRVIRKITPTSLTTQIMTGHGGFSEYLNRFRCKENPSCICEPGKDETVPHILLECPVFSVERHEVETKMDSKITLDEINRIMVGKNREVFLDYCKNIATAETVKPTKKAKTTRPSASKTATRSLREQVLAKATVARSSMSEDSSPSTANTEPVLSSCKKVEEWSREELPPRPIVSDDESTASESYFSDQQDTGRPSYIQTTTKIRGVEMDMATRLANELFLKAKDALETAGNMKRECKATALECLQSLYETVLALSDSRSRHKCNLEKERSRHAQELVRVERAHNKKLQDLTEGLTKELRQARTDITTTLNEAKAVRGWLEYETREPHNKIREINAALKALDERLKHQAHISSNEKPVDGNTHHDQETLTKLLLRAESLSRQLDENRRDLEKIKSNTIHVQSNTEKAIELLESRSRIPVEESERTKGWEQLEEVKTVLSDIKRTISREPVPSNSTATDLTEHLQPITERLEAVSSEIRTMRESRQKTPPPAQSIGAELAIAEIAKKTRAIPTYAEK